MHHVGRKYIVTDNASFHRKKQLYEICSRYGYNLIFLPSYSPELNPIEKYWYVLKHRIKAFLRHRISLNDSIHYSFYVLTVPFESRMAITNHFFVSVGI